MVVVYGSSLNFEALKTLATNRRNYGERNKVRITSSFEGATDRDLRTKQAWNVIITHLLFQASGVLSRDICEISDAYIQ
jgi:hypothetical protein